VYDIDAAGIEGEYTRVISPDREGNLRPEGIWLMRTDKFEEIIKQPDGRQKLKEMFALPGLPTHFSRVSLPEGEALRVGLTNGHREWGSGGAVQYELICGLDKRWFSVPEKIQD